MTTDAKLVGGDDFPQNLEATAKNIPSTNDTDQQTVETQSETAAQPEPPAESVLTIEGAKGDKVKLGSFDLPIYLSWQIATPERAQTLLDAIDRVFVAFYYGENSKAIDEDLNQSLAYAALRLELKEMVVQAATRHLGSFTPAKAFFSIRELPTLAIDDPELANSPVLTDDPESCTDVAKLQEWISALQKMAALQIKISDNHQKIDANQVDTITKQEEAIALLQKQVDNLDRQVKINESRALERSYPAAQHYIDLPLYLTGGVESEVQLVNNLLSDAIDEKTKTVYSHLVVDETEEAFFAEEERKALFNVLDRLSMAVIETAFDNYKQHEYKGQPQARHNSENNRLKELLTRKSAFIDRYAVFTEPDEEKATEAADNESSAEPTE